MAPKKKKKAGSWRSCPGRRLLLNDVRSGRIPTSMEWEDAFSTRPEFDVFPSKKKTPQQLFKDRLARARSLINANTTRAATELVLMQQDLATNPPAAIDYWGMPRWEKSAAQKSLKQDVADGKHTTMTRTQFHQSRPEYKVYPKRYIARKVEQELALQKFLKQYRTRREYY